MNKLVKGSIAGAAGIALLLGGAGTFALWNDTATITGATVNTGELSLTTNADGAWTAPITVLVPGDTTTYTETFDVVATGDNLTANLTATYSDVDGTADGITTTTTVLLDGAAVTGAVAITEGTHTVSVSVEVAFDAAAGDNQNVSKTLGNVVVTLQQT